MIKWILHLFKPMKRYEIDQRTMDANDSRLAQLRMDVSRSAQNIANLTKQLGPRHK